MRLSFIAHTVFLLLGIFGCSNMHRYSRDDLLQKAEFVFPLVYDTIIEPLNSQITPVAKRIFFLKNNISELKEQLYQGGSNHRIARIDDRIDSLRKEMHALQAIRRELINTIYTIYPPYTVAEIVPYQGSKKRYEKITTPIILVTTQDQREYENDKLYGEKMSEDIKYLPLIATAKRQYAKLPDSLKKPIQPLGSPGGVPRIKPYTPPPLPGRD